MRGLQVLVLGVGVSEEDDEDGGTENPSTATELISSNEVAAMNNAACLVVAISLYYRKINEQTQTPSLFVCLLFGFFGKTSIGIGILLSL